MFLPSMYNHDSICAICYSIPLQWCNEGWYIGIWLVVCHLSHLCPEDIFQTTKQQTKLGMMVHHHEPECHVAIIPTSSVVSVGTGAEILKNNFLPYLIIFSTCYNQMWHSDASSRRRVLCCKFGVLSLPPRWPCG